MLHKTVERPLGFPAECICSIRGILFSESGIGMQFKPHILLHPAIQTDKRYWWAEHSGMREVNQFDRIHTHTRTLERWNEITQHLYWTCFIPTPGEASQRLRQLSQTSSSVNFMFSLVSIRGSHYRYVFLYYGIASVDVRIGCNEIWSSHKREGTPYLHYLLIWCKCLSFVKRITYKNVKKMRFFFVFLFGKLCFIPKLTFCITGSSI